MVSPGQRESRPSPRSQHVPSLSPAEQLLAQAQSGRTVIQEFCPLAESLEWQLGQEYLRDRGNKAFISDASPVPFVINNDGTLSYNAAEIFFANLLEAETDGNLTPEEDIFVLELGIGVGLFARFFLDAFLAKCQREGKDYYDRLCYIAADRSERMLLDLLRHGVLAHHPGRYRVRLVDAMVPEKYLPRDVAFQNRQGKPLRAVFLNYLLDCLPAAVLDLQDKNAIRQLMVRTCIARNVRLEEYTDLTADQLVQRAKKMDSLSQQELLEVYGLFASEYDFRPVDMAKLPYADFALKYAGNWGKRLLHSHGAIQSLEKLLDLLHPSGMILINDYGPTSEEQSEDFEHQRFSLATFVGVNFPLLKTYFGEIKEYSWSQPDAELTGIHSRLLMPKPSEQTRSCFLDCFGKTSHEARNKPLEKARQWLQVGRFELASSAYQEALKLQPYNWVLLNEIAMFLIFSFRDIKAGIDMAKLALAQNPTCSAELWNTLGDGLFEFGRLPEARSAYQKALQVNASDIRARYNLAWVHAREKNFPAALDRISEGLALDKMNQYRDRLLQKQQEILALQAVRHQQEYLTLINLVSKYAPQQNQETPKPEVAKQDEN